MRYPRVKRLHQASNPTLARGGTTLVESAFVLPVFFFIVFAIIEFGHAQMVINVMQSACRNGARLGSTELSTTTQVTGLVNQIMSSAFNTSAANIFVLDADVFDTSSTPPITGAALEALPTIELSNAQSRQLILVRATVPYNTIALVPMSFMGGVVLDGQAIMRHE